MAINLLRGAMGGDSGSPFVLFPKGVKKRGKKDINKGWTGWVTVIYSLCYTAWTRLSVLSEKQLQAVGLKQKHPRS